MQAFEQEMKSLRRAIRHWVARIGWPRNEQALVGAKLAHDLGLPSDSVSRILDRTAADLRKLSTADTDAVDARPIIDRAVHELSKLGFQVRPVEEAAIEHYLQALPDRDYQILRYFKEGKQHSEIAALMSTSVDSVRRSLVKTYADLRVTMTRLHDDDGGGLPLAAHVTRGRDVGATRLSS